MIEYCRSCVMPFTRPGLQRNADGTCNACANYARRETIDWQSRRNELERLLAHFHARGYGTHDCIVPVSGGKDSTYQVVRMLEYGMKPLCVNATPHQLPAIGRRNLDNLRRLGADVMEVLVDRRVQRTLSRATLFELGDISWCEHAAMFTIPVRVAVERGIRLIVWGENPQFEYGGPAEDAEKSTLTRDWLIRFGGLFNRQPHDFIGIGGITGADLEPLQYPAEQELERVGVTGIFLGHYLPWDSEQNTLIASAHGFESWPVPVEGCADTSQKLDSLQCGIHEYFKYLKFGYSRASDQVSVHIRPGRLARSDGLNVVRRRDGRYPASYLGVSLQEILAPLGVSVAEFDAVCDSFTNRDLFEKNLDGSIARDSDGTPRKVNYDNPGLHNVRHSAEHNQATGSSRLGVAWRSDTYTQLARTEKRLSLRELYPSEAWSLYRVLPECSSVLDLGSGTGRMAKVATLINPAITYTGVDFNPDLVQESRADLSHQDAEFVHRDVGAFLRENGGRSWDCVMAWAFFYSLPNYLDLLAAAWSRATRYLLFDMRVADLARDVADINRAYVEYRGLREPYVIASWSALSAFCSQLPGVTSFEASGYEFAPSGSVVLDPALPRPGLVSVVLGKTGERDDSGPSTYFRLPPSVAGRVIG